MHTHSLLHRMQQKAKPTSKSPTRTNRRVTKCTHIRFYTECGTWQLSQLQEAQPEPTESHQVHTHSFLHRMRHMAIKPASKSAAKPLRNPKIEKPHAKYLLTSTKYEEHASVPSFVARIRYPNIAYGWLLRENGHVQGL